MRKILFATLLGMALLLKSFPTPAEPDHPHSHPSAGVKNNPLLEEMAILDEVFREVVSAVSLGEGERVRAALEKMHGVMEKTHAGVHEGEVVLRRNGGRMAEFVALDRAFHGRLEELVEAGEANDWKRMLSLTQELLGRCVECHRTFRE